jgi:predicted TIM-barrel fold metal-dependent hydrolase
MTEREFIVDAVAHAYNFAEENLRVPLYSQRFANGTFFKHRAFSPEEYQLSREDFMSDFDAERTAHALFAESEVDVAVFHSTPIYDFFHDGLVSLEKGRLMKERYGDRFLWYGPIPGLDPWAAREAMEVQARDYGVDGFKFYPAAYFEGRTVGWRMDDESLAFPLFEKALELGVRHIAVHKAIPLGPTSMEPYRVDDVEVAAACFPDLTFEVVHGGVAFIEETAMLMARFPNVYANLEGTFGYIVSRPEAFARVLGEMLYWARPEQILFSSGCNVIHPQPLIERFREFQIPESLQQGYGYPPLTDEIKRMILGENMVAMHGLNKEAIRASNADDVFSKTRLGGLAAPWSYGSIPAEAAS